MSKKEIKKIVLAYSGGLDTSIIIPWLKENYNNPEIIAVAADVGQGDELEGLEEKAIKTGASKLYIEDLVDEMVDDVIVPSMMMGAKYEDYLLGTAFARPIIGKRLVDIASTMSRRPMPLSPPSLLSLRMMSLAFIVSPSMAVGTPLTKSRVT